MSAIDWNSALESVNSDQALLLDVVSILQDELPELRSHMEAALEAKENVDVARAAHKLKGSVRFLGPTTVHDLAECIELMEPKNPVKVSDLYASLTVALDDLSRELDQYKQTHNVPPL